VDATAFGDLLLRQSELLAGGFQVGCQVAHDWDRRRLTQIAP
jgi:hypothetical protein